MIIQIKTVILAGCCALGALLFACRKEVEPPTVPLPAEMAAYTLFQPGTHWVYQDSATGTLDSVWVVKTE